MPFVVGGSTQSRKSIRKTFFYLFNAQCKDLRGMLYLYLGPYRNFIQLMVYYNCDPIEILFITGFVVNIISLCFDMCFFAFLLYNKLYTEHRNQQVICSTCAGIFVHLSFAYYIIYRYVTDSGRTMCLLGCQILLFGTQVFLFSMVSLSADCMIAVCRPMQYRFIVTKRRMFFTYSIALSALSVESLVYPMLAYGSMYDGWLLTDCAWFNLVPESYIIASTAVSSFLIGLVTVMNAITCTCVVASMFKRKELGTNQDLLLRNSVTKLAARLGTAVVFNFGSALPLILDATKIVTINASIGFLCVAFLGIESSLFFFFSDPKAKQIVAKCLSCKKN